MKPVIFISFLAYLFILTACDKDEYKNPYVLHISLTEDIYHEITEIIPIAYLVDGTRHSIGKSRKKEKEFEISIQNPIHKEFLYPIGNFADFSCAPVINKKNVLCYGALSFLAYKGDQRINSLLQIRSVVHNDYNTDAYSINYMYVEENVTVIGDCIADGEVYKSFDLRLNAGWNRYMCIEKIRKDHTTIKYTSDITEDIPWILSR